MIDLTDEDNIQVKYDWVVSEGILGFGWMDPEGWQRDRALSRIKREDPLAYELAQAVATAEQAEQAATTQVGEVEWEEETLGSQDTQDPEPEPVEHKCDHPGYYGYCPDGGFVEPATLEDYREMRAAQWRASRELGPPLDTSGKRVVPPRRKRPLPKE